ncbi:DUF3450 family protein [Akkermansiaceae bacterium]|nr:DUF3450 family protein [Akkermansiaceae bacterium]
MLRLSFIFLFLSLPVRAQDADANIIELREIISRIVDVQALESGERLAWEARKAEMAALLELHRKEIALLDEELAEAGKSAPGHDSSTESIRYEIEDLKNTRRLASEAVARNVPRALSISASLPAPLLREVDPELAALRTWKPSGDPREALSSILSLIGKSQQFNRRFTRSTETIAGREAEILYLGLGCAFYADGKGSGGIGRPGPSGWTWEARPALFPQIRSAFASLDKKSPPVMVELPLEIR